jgi:hypothetical protein
MSFWKSLFGGKPKPPPATTPPTPAAPSEAAPEPPTEAEGPPRVLVRVRTVLYQADEEIRARLVSSEAALNAYLDRMVETADAFLQRVPPQPGRLLTLFVALKPGMHRRFWIESEPPGFDSRSLAELLPHLEELPPPLVQNGPIALAVQASLWNAEGPEENWPTMPREWVEASHHRSLLIPDGLLEVLWPD